ncbi:hypothetical protein GCM10010331_69850 [Streptomyces xanthochromogenes]|uniref:hypothetical protein n=1 Tax=Streptomyces xanthochromogenes TaxID=67384 RepID=UPI0016765ADB|nr:hypothetical protein [Streptomyces xanthochromogenes]GHB71872.1 hypothetical protein GCM10010331_69850 [Streptomyces xanthochromogenes]
MSQETAIGEGSGQISGTTVLPPNGAHSRFRSNYQGTGTLAGHQVQVLITYEAESVGPDAFAGTSDALITTTDGSDSALWRGAGAGFRAAGATQVVWRGYAALESQSPRFADLNGALLDVVVKVDDDGKVSYQATKWR